MKRVLQIGHNDIRLFLRMKAGYVWLFVVPLVFVYFFGIAFRGPGAPSNPRPAVLIENHDTGFLGTLLTEQLDAKGMRLVDQTKRDEAERGIRIPADFTDMQIIFFLLLGQFIFKVNLGQNLLAILLTLGLYAWVAASLGVWIGAVVKNEDKIIGLCVLASSIMAALGGCWWPLEIVPATLQAIAHCVPTGWAMDALHQLISFVGGWETVFSKLGVLALFAAGANLGAARMFRY